MIGRAIQDRDGMSISLLRCEVILTLVTAYKIVVKSTETRD